jgi:dolichol-phosphate mannosyltransferase
MKKVSIVIPVYYNAESIPFLFERLRQLEAELLAIDLETELIFVDDGSGDDSLARLLEMRGQRPATKVVKLTRNFGAVHASKTGFHFVTGDCFTILAADLQDPPELILEMARRWKEGAKFIICERSGRDDPAVSKLFAAIHYRLLHLLVMRDFPQGGYDMALMDRAMLAPLRDSSKNLYTPLLAYWLGYRPQILHYRRARREHGKSRWTFSKKFTAFLDIMLGFSVTPIRFISGLGVVVAVASFLYGGLVVVNALFGNIPVPGFAAIASLISFLLGLVIIMLGVIGEYLWRVFDEVNRRPETVIDEIY